MSSIRNVALLIETSRSYGRKMLSGIANYARAHGRWAFHLAPGDLVQTLPPRNVWDGDGIIARVETPALARQLARRNLPTVVLNRRFASDKCPGVGGNQRLACRMIGEHYLTRGFRRMAYCGIAELDYSRVRQADFREFLNENGIEPEVFWYSQQGNRRAREQTRLIEWLRRLAKPVGLFVCDDVFARTVIDACGAGDVAVPEEIAVVGFDNDEPLCELANPPLSSMANNSARIGFEAAALLDRLMSDKPIEQPWLEVDPLGIVTRKSSDRWAIEDPDVAAAVRYIRENASRPIGVGDIVSTVSLSRRSLELRFKRALRRSPLDEINSVRVERAKELLTKSDFKLSRIATACGFHSLIHFHTVFRRHASITPLAFRHRTRGTAQ